MIFPDDFDELSYLWDGLPDKERAVVLKVARRLMLGLRTYGPFKDGDPRDMRREASEELLDACVYLARDLETTGDDR